MMSRAPSLAAAVAAVLLPVVVGATDEKDHDAPGARQRVNGNGRVQGSVATARNLDVGQNRGTNALSNARLWVYDRRLELLTRAFTLFGAPRSSCSRPLGATSRPCSQHPVVGPTILRPGTRLWRLLDATVTTRHGPVPKRHGQGGAIRIVIVILGAVWRPTHVGSGQPEWIRRSESSPGRRSHRHRSPWSPGPR
jgi:hypothetical protein